MEDTPLAKHILESMYMSLNTIQNEDVHAPNGFGTCEGVDYDKCVDASEFASSATSASFTLSVLAFSYIAMAKLMAFFA